MRILLADDDPDRATYLARALHRDGGFSVVCIAPGQLLSDAVALHAPDVVLVDMTRPDRDALDGVRQLSSLRPHAVVLFVDEDDPAFMEAAIAAGVCSYNVGAVAPAAVKPVLRAAVALFRRHQQTHAALTEAEAQLRERATIDRAKAVLMRARRISEPDAYRWLQRQAMDSGRRMAEVAQEVLQGDGKARP